MIKEIKKEEFNELSKCFPNVTFYQTSNWADLKSFTGWKALFLGYYEDGLLEAIGLFLLKKMPGFNSYLAYSPRGFLANFNDSKQLKNINDELISYLKQQKVFQLIIDPYLPLNKRDIDGNIVEGGFDNTAVVDSLVSLGYKHTGFNLNYENLNPRWLFRLDIKNKTFDEIKEGFRKEAKRRASKKDIFGINVRELRDDEIQTFKDLMNKTSQRKGFIDRPLEYYVQMYNALHNDGILRYMVAEIDIDKCRANINEEIKKQKAKLEKLNLHPATNEGRIKEETVTLNSHERIIEQLDKCEKQYGKVAPLSVVCLLTYGSEAIMLLAGNDEEYLQHFNTSNIIVSELIKLSMEEDYSYYNFYGITGNFDPSNENYGLYTYKKQYGGEVVEMIGQFEYTIDSFKKGLYDQMLKLYKLTK